MRNNSLCETIRYTKQFDMRNNSLCETVRYTKQFYIAKQKAFSYLENYA